MLTHTQLLITHRPRPTQGKFVLLHGDQHQQPSALGTVTAAPHPVPLPSGSYTDNGGGGQDSARVWLTPADFAALCSCVGTSDAAVTLAHNGSVVTGFYFAAVQAPLHSMADSLKALEQRLNNESEALRSDVTAIRLALEELLRRLPPLRHDGADALAYDEPVVPLVRASSTSGMAVRATFIDEDEPDSSRAGK